MMVMIADAFPIYPVNLIDMRFKVQSEEKKDLKINSTKFIRLEKSIDF